MWYGNMRIYPGKNVLCVHMREYIHRHVCMDPNMGEKVQKSKVVASMALLGPACGTLRTLGFGHMISTFGQEERVPEAIHQRSAGSEGGHSHELVGEL